MPKTAECYPGVKTRHTQTKPGRFDKKERKSKSMMPPNIDPRSGSQTQIWSYPGELLDRINNKSTNATGVVEAQILLTYVIKMAEKRPELHNASDIYNTCKLMAPQCGLSARDQKRALTRIQSML